MQGPHGQQTPGLRLRFIDLARTVAILMMLEGHFVGLALEESAKEKGWLPFDIWLYIRGITAPIFFTVTGLVFSFLLCRHAAEPGFFRLTRVRKGFLRAFELFFWGYAVQLNLRRLPDYLEGNFGSWTAAFHVLQCIGAGLLVMIAVFGLWRLIGRGPLWLWFAGAAVVFYLSGVALTAVPEEIGFPAGAPAAIQNIFRGPNSSFTIAPWLGFTLYGAMAGALLRRHIAAVRHPAFPLGFIALGLIFRRWGGRMDRAVGEAMSRLPGFESAEPLLWFHLRAGEALLFLGLLMAWENRFGIRESRFLVIGRNTFPIYVIHVIILYGGIFGFGLNLWLKEALGFGPALLGALGFLLFFAALAQVIDPLTTRWRTFKESRLRRRE
jgi:hypothetical protein